jgi:quinol monooxygenase YgiN
MIPSSRSTSMKVVTSLVTPAPEKLGELLQVLRSLRDEVSREPGCRSCVVCRDIEGGDHLVFLSEWESQDDLYRHLDSDRFRVLAGATRLLGASAEFRFVASDTPPNAFPHP